MTTWSVALDAQLDLIRFWRSGDGAKTGNLVNLVPAMSRGLEVDLTDPAVEAQVNAMGRQVADEAVSQLDSSATYWVAREVNDLLGKAATTLPAVAPRVDDLPHPNGFIFFEDPLHLHAAIDPERQPYLGEKNQETITAVQWASDGDRVGVMPYFGGPQILRVTPLGTPLGAYHWAWGSAIDNGPGGNEIACLVVAFWLLSQQRITRAAVRPVDRATKRRAARARFEMPEDGVRVVTLRRVAAESSPAEAVTVVDWSHRWVVDGHWRQQWYPSLDEHRPIWIAPHVKGPDGKPLVLRDRVYRFTR